jgi:hypothetical protein
MCGRRFPDSVRAPRLRAAPVLGLSALAFALLATDVLQAQVFLRGDANSDGRVTGSDAQYLFRFLALGGEEPQCLRSAEINGDGKLDISDPIGLLIYLVDGGGQPPCAPYPEPGEDPLSEIPCKAYDPEPPADDPRFVLEVGDAIASVDGTTALTISITNPEPIAGYFGALTIDGGSFGRVDRVTDLSGTFSSAGFIGAQAFGGKIRFGFLPAIGGGAAMEADERRAVLRVECCLESELASGDYSVTAEWTELTDARGHAVLPQMVAGTLAVPDDLGATGCRSPRPPSDEPRCGPGVPPEPTCSPDPALRFLRGDVNLDGRLSIADALRIRESRFAGGPPLVCCDAADANDDGGIDFGDIDYLLTHLHLGGPPPLPPFPQPGPDPMPDNFGCAADTIVPAAVTDDVLALGEVSGLPGQTVRIPVVVSNAARIDGFQLVVRVDPGLLSPPDPEEPALAFEGSFYEEAIAQRGLDYGVVQAIPGEPDMFVVAFITTPASAPLALPPGEEWTVFAVLMRLSPQAAVGTDIEVELSDGPEGAGIGPAGLRNELSSAGNARLPRLGAPGVVHVVGGVPVLRGDSNHDGSADISDGLFTLNWLFLGGPRPVCPDEADVNDDGRIDTSDPVALINYLFLDGRQPSLPFPEPGLDPTADELAECVE